MQLPTKSTVSSKTVWGAIVAFAGGAINFVHGVNVVGLAQAVIDNWPAIATMGGSVLAVYGRIRASALIAPPAGTVPISSSKVSCILTPVLIVALGSMGLTSCDNLTEAQKAQFAALQTRAVAIGSTFVNAAAAYGTAVAASKIKPGNPYLDSVASGLRTLQGTPLVTEAQINDIITSFGDPNNPDAWETLGEKVGDIVTNYGANTITNTGLETASLALNELNEAATKLQAEAAATAP